MSHAPYRYTRPTLTKRPVIRLAAALATLFASSIVTHATAHAGPLQRITTANRAIKPVTVKTPSGNATRGKVSAVRSTGDVQALHPPAKVVCSPQDFALLARLVHAEAANQPFLGQVAVAAVVLNRLKSPGFPKTIKEIIEQPGQFDSYNSARFWSAPNASAYSAVQAALQGSDPIKGALYYYNPQMPYAAWMNTLPVTTTIGNQIFCQ